MFQKLTKNHCLYHIDQNTLELFLDLASTYSFKEDIQMPLSLNSIDNCAVVLQIWCTLNEEDYHFVFDTDKMMAYGSNHYFLGVLKRDKNILSFLKVRPNEQRVKYVLSYYLALVALQWVHELMIQHEIGLALIETNKTRNYFLFSEEEQLIHNEQHHFYATQRYVTQLLAFDYQNSDRYHTYIETALRLAKDYLTKH